MRIRKHPGRAVRLLAVTAVGALLATVAACGGGGSGEDGNVTIRFDYWGSAERAKATNDAIALFEQANPGIKVESSFSDFGGYFQKLATQVAGGSAPDVLQMDYSYVREYADRGVLAQLDSGEAQVQTSGLSQQLLSGGSVDSKLFAIPIAQNTQMFSYDAAQWEKVGATEPTDTWKWSDLQAAAQKVTDGTGKKVYGLNDFGGVLDWFEVWLRQQGKQLYTEDGKLGYTEADVTAWWKLSDSWRTSGAVTPAEITTKIDGTQENDPVAQKKSSATFGYDSGFTPKLWEQYGRELTATSFPTDTGKRGQFAKPAMMLSIAQRSDNKKAAAKLVDFLIHDTSAGTALGMSRGLPADEKVRELVGATLQGPPKAAYEYEQKVLATLDTAPPPPPKGAGEVKVAFQRVYDDVIFGRATVEASATKFISEAQRAISS
ncbi:extracellular solute-binding protein [Actinoplanes sichuanensis]|uniref:ABC transporter substrate-binding protein n=1 Tax=Actinoplanes sichuanensis TaxID=512349 RepID=A0ABW4AU08_9ACTN|nr:extracellular solute-binding protein [Actinoplanes sichuanensis]BEL04452.1 extracellular solute-binding protein [Actinoplanes sichuanensis]